MKPPRLFSFYGNWVLLLTINLLPHLLQSVADRLTSLNDCWCMSMQGADRQRRKRLKSAAVVGVTCCSAGLPVLEGHSFDVVLLDEASQMVEPLTLNPLTTAKPR